MDVTTIIRIFSGLLVLCIAIVPAIFYLITLSRALEKCSPQSRTMDPGMVWLLLIPLFNIIWSFFVVLALAASLGNEFRTRGVTNVEPEPGKTIGLAKCICAACGIIPFLGILTGLASIVLWVVYWTKIAEFSRMLEAVPAPTSASPVTPGF